MPSDEKVIIWCRFVEEIKALKELLGDQAVMYYGEVTKEERVIALNRFQGGIEIDILKGAEKEIPHDPNTRFFIANQSCAGLGLTLTVASTVIYFSNDFSFANRMQSEDRCHRIGQKKNVTYIDLISPKTIDEKILKALRSKKSMADLITGDKVEEWIKN